MNLETFQNSVFPAKNKLFRFAFHLLGSSEEAKDVVQEVFIKVWNGRDQLDEIQNMEAWCMRITKNLSLDRLRQQKRQATDEIEKGFQIEHTDRSPLENTEINESMKRIGDLMAALPDKPIK